MLLREKLEKTGDLFFRWRSYIPLCLIPLLVFEGNYFYFGSTHSTDVIFEFICFLVAIFGVAIRAFSVGYSGAGTSGKNTTAQVAKSLNKNGIYSVVRNPLYIGNAFITIGLSMLSKNLEVIVVNLFLFILFYIPIILREEQFLLQTFGEEFSDYAKHTPALLPNFRLWKKPELKFNLIRVLYREHDTSMGIVGGFYVFEVLNQYVITKRFYFYEIDKAWTILLFVSLGVWAVLKGMKRYLKTIDKQP